MPPGKSLALAFGCLLLLGGCQNRVVQRSVYWPGIVTAPTLAETGDKHLSVHGTPIQAQAGAAWAPLRHLALRAAADGSLSAFSWDLGIGAFGAQRDAEGVPLREGLRWSLTAGIGGGRSSTWTASNEVSFDEDRADVVSDWRKSVYVTEFDRETLQADLARVSERYEIIAALRATAIHGRIRQTAYRKVTGEDLERHRSERPLEWIALDPVFIVRARLGGRAMGEVQLGGSSMHGDGVSEFQTAGLLFPFVIAAGASMDF